MMSELDSLLPYHTPNCGGGLCCLKLVYNYSKNCIRIFKNCDKAHDN